MRLTIFSSATRLAPGQTLDDACAESAVVAERSTRQTTDTASKTRLRLTPGSTLGARWNFAPVMGVVLAATMMVLLIACANIANLVLARGAARKTEFGMRLAIGASRSRLVGQLLTESVLLAVLGGFAGLLLAWWSVKALALALVARFGVDSGETGMYLAPDWRVLAFAAALSVVTGFVFGVLPALRAIRGDLAASITKAGASVGGERGHATLRQVLIVAEVVVCFVLLVAGGLLLRGLTELDAISPGFDPTRVLVVEARLDLLRYDETHAQQFHHELAARVTGVGGVETLTRVASVPLAGMPRRPIELDTGDKGANQVLRAFRNAVAPNYFEALQIPILRGRGFTEEDTGAGGNVVVVSASTSQRLWPNQEPIGQRLRPEPGATFAEVIGVAEDVQVRLDDQDPLFFYIPIQTWAGTTLLVRTSGDLPSVKDRVMAAARSIDPKVLVEIDSVADRVAASSTAGAARAASTLATCLGILALLLAGVGLYGVMACTKAERTGEIAVRIALGASHVRVQGLVMRQGLRLVFIGAVIGIVVGANVAGLFLSLLFGISPFDPLAYAGVSAFLFAVALLATMVARAPCILCRPNDGSSVKLAR
jgi:predicted permease